MRNDAEIEANLVGLLQAGPFFFGLLDEDEQEAAIRLIERKQVRRTYEGAAGFMGLSKIELVKP